MAWLIPVGEALAGPSLFCSAGELLLYEVPGAAVRGVALVVGTVGPVVVGDIVPESPLFGLAFITPVGEAFIGPWLTTPAPVAAPAGEPP